MRDRRKKRLEEAVRSRQLDVSVLLENVDDSHNVGAVMRTCDSVGVQHIHAVNHRTLKDPNEFKLGKKTTAGTRKWVDVHLHDSLEGCIPALKEKYGRLLATGFEGDARSVYEADLTRPFSIMFGNERDGLTEEALAAADEVIYIPQKGLVRSLNISVACAVILYEMFRQRMEAGLYEHDLDGPGRQELLSDFQKRHESGYRGRYPKI